MDIRIAKWWSRALRSGEYKQCEGVLRKSDFRGGYEYCVLGVLQDLASRSSTFHGHIEWNQAYLSTDVLEWADMNDQYGDYAPKGNISSDNDFGMKFPKLATIIDEKNQAL